MASKARKRRLGSGSQGRSAKCWGCGEMIRLTKDDRYVTHKSRRGLTGPKVYPCSAIGGQP